MSSALKVAEQAVDRLTVEERLELERYMRGGSSPKASDPAVRTKSDLEIWEEIKALGREISQQLPQGKTMMQFLDEVRGPRVADD